MFGIVASILLASVLPERDSRIVGYVPVTIVTGTNVVENIPALPILRPCLADFRAACVGDTVVWTNAVYVYDGITWGDVDAEKICFPIPDRFEIVRTASVTNVWCIGFVIDVSKAPCASGLDSAKKDSGSILGIR